MSTFYAQFYNFKAIQFLIFASVVQMSLPIMFFFFSIIYKLFFSCFFSHSEFRWLCFFLFFSKPLKVYFSIFFFYMYFSFLSFFLPLFTSFFSTFFFCITFFLFLSYVTYLSIYLSFSIIYLSMCLSFCLYLCLCLCIRIYLFLYLSLSLPSYIHSSFFFLPSFLPYFFILPPSSSLSLYLCRYFSLIKAMRIYILCLAALRTLALLSVIIYLHLHWTPKPQTCFQLSLSDYLRVTVLELPLA